MKTIAHCYRGLIKSLEAKQAKSQFKGIPPQPAATVSDLCVGVPDSWAFTASTILLCFPLINLSVYFVGGQSAWQTLYRRKIKKQKTLNLHQIPETSKPTEEIVRLESWKIGDLTWACLGRPPTSLPLPSCLISVPTSQWIDVLYCQTSCCVSPGQACPFQNCPPFKITFLCF